MEDTEASIINDIQSDIDASQPLSDIDASTSQEASIDHVSSDLDQNRVESSPAPALLPKPSNLQSPSLNSKSHSGWFRVVGSYRKGVLQIVVDELKRLGFRYAPNEVPNENISIFWSRSFFHLLPSLKPHQKVNWMPGMNEICRKDILGKNITEYARKFGYGHFDFWPNSFNLPQQFNEFIEEFTQRPVPYILKPPMAARGEGIRLMTKLEDIQIDSEFIQTKIPLAQRYIQNPLLFQGKYKMSFRFYVALTSVDPLRIYIYKDGLVRICSTPYSTELASYDNLLVHLTNYDLHVSNESNFVAAMQNEEDPELTLDGLRADWQEVVEMLKARGQDTDKMWSDIKDLVVKSFIAAENPLTRAVKAHVKIRGSAYEVCGFDVLLDDQCKPWLLEVNHTPSLCPHTDLENNIKRMMLRDLFQLVDLQKNHIGRLRAQHRALLDEWQQLKNCKIDLDDSREKLKEVQMEQLTVATENPKTESSLAPNATEESQPQLPPSRTILPFPVDEDQNIVPDRFVASDLWCIIDTDEENKRRGNWDRCFPEPDTSGSYIPFLSPNRTKLIAMWQQHAKHPSETSILKRVVCSETPRG